MDAFLTPALIVSGVTFLTLLFGKIIADEREFADDRNWHIQLSGLIFVLIFIPIPAALGYWIATLILDWFGFSFWVQAVSLALLVYNFFTLIVVAEWHMRRRYPFTGRSLVSKLSEKFETEMEKDTDFGPIQTYLRYYRNAKKHMVTKGFRGIGSLLRASIFFFYIASLYWISESYLWSIAVMTFGFGGLIIIAYIRSMQVAKKVTVNIYFTDGREPLKSVTLLRVNDDNIKIRESEQAVLLNKSLVTRIEEIPAK